MKAKISIIVMMVIVMTASCVLSQTGFYDKSQRVTSGFIDKNPAFDGKRTLSYGLSYITFLVFERHTLPDNSNICVLKFGFDSAFGGVKYLTNDANAINRNPQIAFKHITGPDSIINAMVVWEKVENSRVNIYGSTYYNSVWSLPYPIDTGAGIKSNPRIAYNTVLSNNYLYSIVYEKDGDIIYKNYESVLKQVWNSANLTDSIPDVCRNPNVSSLLSSQPVFVTYERQKTNGDYALYYKKASSNYLFTGDSIALRGNNRNVCFINGYTGINLSYESNFSGKWGIYEYDYGSSGQPTTLLQSTVFNYRNLRNYLYPVITNSPSYFSSMLTAYIVQRPLVTKLMSTVYLNPPMDSITIGDSVSTTVMTQSSGLFRNMSSLVRVWMVFSKDSAGYSTLDARGKLIAIGGVTKSGNEVPLSYSLGQNYPNPFNSSSKLKFEIANLRDVKIIVYDIMGREVKTLVNERLQPGTYEVTFDSSMLSSGVYFYRLVAGEFSETKRMLLIK